MLTSNEQRTLYRTLFLMKQSKMSTLEQPINGIPCKDRVLFLMDQKQKTILS